MLETMGSMLSDNDSNHGKDEALDSLG